MEPNQLAAYKALRQASTAIKVGDKTAARQFAVRAAELAPELEEVWLMMAALSAPRASMQYFEKALQVNPESQRAQNGLVLAAENLRKTRAEKAVLAGPAHISQSTLTELPDGEQPDGEQPKRASNRNRVALAAVLVLFMVCCFAAIASGVTPVAALFGNVFGAPGLMPGAGSKSTQVAASLSTEVLMVAVLPQAGSTSVATSTVAPTLQPTVTATLLPTETPAPTETPVLTETPTLILTETPTEGISPTPLPSDTPEPTQAVVPTLPSGSSSGSATTGPGGVHWIDVDLTHQMVYAYEGQTIVNSFLVSTGATPRLTVTGSYHIYEKHVKANMWGPGYFLPDVPYTMYFYKGYALHGTYWHSNFGTPMSHGCVNLSIPDAEWLYYWALMGTLVKVHY